MSRKSPSSDRIVLKVLSGTQSGAEVALEPGDYTLGAGADDDIHLIDISLKPGHARLRIGATKVEIIGAEGSLVSANGVEFPAQGETWFELEPLEIVSAGTTRFALGPVHANWTSLSDAALGVTGRPKAAAGEPTGWRRHLQAASRWTNRGILAILVAILIAVVFQQVNSGALMPELGRQGSLVALRDALRGQPFASTVTLREDVDGSIYATGWVETAVDRRAVAAVAEKLGIPLRTRINVRQTMRGEIDTLIASAKVSVTATLSPEGVVRLDGLILRDEVAGRFVERLKTDVIGIADVDNHIRTAKTLLADIEKLAKKVQIDGFVVFRLNDQTVEVNGILPVEKIDAWVGFIQAYSKNFAKDIALRSYVQLQANAAASGASAEAGPAPPVGPAISIGPRDTNSPDIALDMDRVRRGLYELSDLFVGLKRRPATANAAIGAAPAAGTPPTPADGPPPPAAAVEAAPPVPSRDFWQLTTPAAAADPAPALPQAPLTSPVPQAQPGPSSAAREPWQLTAPVPAAPGPTVAPPGAGASGPMGASLSGPGASLLASGLASPSSSAPTESSAAAGGASQKSRETVAPSGGELAGVRRAALAATGDGREAEARRSPPSAAPADASGRAPSPASPADAHGRVPSPASPADASGRAPSPTSPVDASGRAVAVDRSGGGQPAGERAASPPETRAAPSPQVPPATARPASDVPRPLAEGPPAGASTAGPREASLPPATETASSATRALSDAANRLISRWLAGAAGRPSLPAAIQATLDRVAETRASIDPKEVPAERQSKPEYLPLIATDLPDGTARNEICWPGSRLSVRNLPTAMFWLDVLSVSQQLSLKTFTLDEQRFLLEAAANPQRVRACLENRGSSERVALTSLYLNEALRNPDFIRFVVRDLIASDVDIAGIHLSDDRFFQTRDGVKHREGTTLDIGRRITAIGELASVLRSNLGYLVVPYGAEVNWKLTPQ